MCRFYKSLLIRSSLIISSLYIILFSSKITSFILYIFYISSYLIIFDYILAKKNVMYVFISVQPAIS